MFPYGWSVLGLGFGLLVLSIYPMAMGSFVLRVEDDSKVYNKRNIEQKQTNKETGESHDQPCFINYGQNKVETKI